jgi:rod shape determining protein RodA
MRIDRRLIAHFEWQLPILALAIVGLGTVCVYSASREPGMEGLPPLVMRQLTWLAAGCVGMLLAVTFDYRRVDRSAWGIYAVVLLMILAVPFVGRVAGGSRRWIGVGPVSIQPSELMKVGLALILAHIFGRTRAVGLTLWDTVIPLVVMAVPAAAVLAQPDLGTAALLGVLTVTMLALGGVRLRWLLLLGSPGLLMAPILWERLKDYQQKRILTFLNPDLDPLGSGYHVIQSKIAVGSGMIWGKGFLQGTQNHLDFLPEQHTDFIFSVFAEEWGFVGACTLLALYLMLLLRMVMIAARTRDRFGVLLTLAIGAIFFWQVTVNVGMTTGVLPVVGVPLPLFSYGGSSLFSLLIGVGLVMNVSMRRNLF